MTWNLASQASNRRKQDQLVSYLTQARKQLKTLVPKSSNSDNKKSAQASAIGIVQADKKPIDGQSNLETMKAPSDIPEVIVWLNQLIAHAPKSTPLLTTEILDKPQR